MHVKEGGWLWNSRSYQVELLTRVQLAPSCETLASTPKDKSRDRHREKDWNMILTDFVGSSHFACVNSKGLLWLNFLVCLWNPHIPEVVEVQISCNHVHAILVRHYGVSAPGRPRGSYPCITNVQQPHRISSRKTPRQNIISTKCFI